MNLPNGYLLQKGKYKLKQVIGQGGFGITYKGIWHTEVKGSLGAMRTEVPVCIKEYFFKDYCVRDAYSFRVKVHSDTGKLLFDKFKEKLIKEAKILSEVHHPYIVNVLEVFEENNTAYIAMEYIAGNSLKDKLAKEGMLPEAEVLRYIHQIGEALQFVHQKNILHLDIKPSNILIDKDNNARLIDFGVSKRYDVGEQETSTTMLTLSKGFASIEQYDNEGIQSFSPCPDIYSLGATMYNLLTGKIPTESILRATRPLAKPRELNPAISEQTEQVILKAMEIIPANRYQSVEEMMNALGGSDYKKLDVSTPQDLSASEGDEETTLLYSSSPKDDQEETLLNVTDEELVQKVKEKKSSHSMVAVTTSVLLLVAGSAAGLYYYEEKKNPPKQIVDQSFIKENEEDVVANVSLVDSIKKQDETSQTSVPKKNVETATVKVEKQEPVQKPVSTSKKSTGTEQVSSSPKTENDKPAIDKKTTEDQNITISPPSKEQVQSFYNRLLASGKEKMNAKDYTGAKNDFTLAKDQMITEEVMRLLIACDEKIEEQHITERKAQYEEKMPFGRYTIVRKKSNNRYGAIDNDGQERIPCKYLSVGKADKGRAFEREDNLYDIYASDGSIITKGATYY
ncbi:MAG TPA: protein kinase [Candidatus Parabacteroides faecavium]|nr:protein kinase [Candidatus Parabacteroides faecavium]